MKKYQRKRQQFFIELGIVVFITCCLVPYSKLIKSGTFMDNSMFRFEDYSLHQSHSNSISHNEATIYDIYDLEKVAAKYPNFNTSFLRSLYGEDAGNKRNKLLVIYHDGNKKALSVGSALEDPNIRMIRNRDISNIRKQIQQTNSIDALLEFKFPFYDTYPIEVEIGIPLDDQISPSQQIDKIVIYSFYLQQVFDALKDQEIPIFKVTNSLYAMLPYVYPNGKKRDKHDNNGNFMYKLIIYNKLAFYEDPQELPVDHREILITKPNGCPLKEVWSLINCSIENGGGIEFILSDGNIECVQERDSKFQESICQCLR